ncbi:MAG TPA: preprotein translocase subunit SecE [Tepidisphaeraceae bacterium]|nr:preprotein translocase subunit SecE [Tepidisphaeraceae bacterium]
MASGATTPNTRTDDDRPPEKTAADSAKGGFFTVYKKGQGYYTRLGTAIGAGLIITTTLIFAYNQLRTWPLLQTNGNVNTAAVAGILAVLALAMGLLAWWLMNRPTNAEFLIATDSEMKKVNWTSWKDLVGSTRVVIFFMFATAIFLFVVDILFGYLFHLMTVLRTSPFG